MAHLELAQDPFDVDEFVERLAWRANQSASDHGTSFDPMVLHGAFCQTIQQLMEHERKLEKQSKHLEKECIEEEIKQRCKVKDLLRENQKAFHNFQALDKRINSVATKVVGLGDQLESVNIPRARNAEALHMMKYLNVYFTEDGVEKDGMLDDPHRLEEAAELVHKLNAIAADLPPHDPKFERAKKRVLEAYTTIENNLIENFLNAYNYGQVSEMKRMCDVMRNGSFRRYPELINRFIEESQKQAFGKKDIFVEIEHLCVNTAEIITRVFVNPEYVTAKLVLNIYHDALQKHIQSHLEPNPFNMQPYLSNLSQLYASTCQLSNTLLEKLKLGSDTTFLLKLNKKLFDGYLEGYIKEEYKYLKDKTSTILDRYYESRNHVKKTLQAGGISDQLRREVQSKIRINIGPNVEDYTGEEVAISILQEFKLAYGRCKNLVPSKDLPQHAAQIYDILVQYICSEFIDYAIELALYHCPLAESRTAPNLHFLSAVSDTSAIVHLFEKQFSDSLWPIIYRTSQQAECVNTKNTWIETYETKLDLGLERTLMAVSGYVKHLLSTEQKRTDFKPESSDISMMHSMACAKAVAYINSVITAIRSQIDGENLDALLLEMGLRLHKIVYDHLLQYQYNSMGAMLAICDVNEYRSCIKSIGSDSVVQLFDVLHALCNLLVVPPDNLKQVCVGEPLGTLDKVILKSFISLRSDYKTAQLATVLGR